MKVAKVLLMSWGAVSLALCLGLCVADILKTQWASEINMSGYIYVQRFVTVTELTLYFGAVTVGLMIVISLIGSLIFSDSKVNDY